MNKRVVVAGVVALVVIAVAIAGVSANLINKNRLQQLFFANQVRVRVASVVNVSDYPIVKVTGASRIRLAAGEMTSSVYARMEGYLVFVRDKDNPFVRQGDVLAKFDLSEMNIQYQQALARAGAAQAKVKQAERGAVMQSELFEKNGTAKAVRDNAIDVYKIEQQNLVAEQAAVTMLQEKMKDEVVAAPVTGFIIRSNAKPGMVVAKGQNLFEIADTRVVSLNFLLNDNEVKYFNEGAKVRIEPNNQSEGRYIIDGVVRHMEKEPYAQGNRWDVTISIENTDDKLAGHKFAVNDDKSFLDDMKSMLGKGFTVYLPNAERAKAVQRHAILYKNGSPFVYIVNGKGMAEERAIQIGVSYGDDYVEVISGLEEGEKVIFVGQEKVRNGMKVTWQ